MPSRFPVRLLTVGAALLLAGCGDAGGPTAPSTTRPLSETVETPAFILRHAGGDTVHAAWQQAYHEWAIAALGVSVNRRITFNKYFDRTHMGEVVGVSNTNAYADPATYAIHTIWPRDNHEVVHLYASTFGSPVALLSEGLAVAYQTDPVAGDLTPRWSGTSLHQLARQFLAQGRLIPLADLLTSTDFRRFDPNVTYPESGSFIRYLIDRDGLATFKALYGRVPAPATAAAVREALEATYGRSLATLEADWRAFVTADGTR